MKLGRAYVRQYTVHLVLDLAYNFSTFSKRRHPTTPNSTTAHLVVIL